MENDVKTTKKSCLRPSFTNIKGTKHLLYSVEKTMGSDSYSYDSNTDEENTVFEEFEPKLF